MEFEMKFGIDFTNGATVFTDDWDAMREHIKTGNVLMVIVCASGEILFDACDGWDIVTDGPPRYA